MKIRNCSSRFHPLIRSQFLHSVVSLCLLSSVDATNEDSQLVVSPAAPLTTIHGAKKNETDRHMLFEYLLLQALKGLSNTRQVAEMPSIAMLNNKIIEAEVDRDIHKKSVVLYKEFFDFVRHNNCLNHQVCYRCEQMRDVQNGKDGNTA